MLIGVRTSDDSITHDCLYFAHSSLRLPFHGSHSCFFNVAKDPAASNPKNHESQLGYTLFGLGGGQVDLAQQLVQIYDQVTAQGATAATFWDIQATFNLLRDAHVTIPALKVPLTSSTLSVVPERTAQYGTTAMVQFAFDANAQLQLELLWSHIDGSQSISRVDTMNGKTVAQFVLDLANSPALGIPFQSVGARVNALMALGAQSLVGGSVTNKYQFRYFLFNLYSSGRPSDILPDSFPVTYVDGTQETFYTVAVNPLLDPYVPYSSSYQQSSSSMVQINRTQVEAVLNEPGDSFLNFRNVIGQINNATSSTGTLNRTLLQQEASWPNVELAGATRRLANSSSSGSTQLYAWDKVLNFSDVINGGMVSAAAYKIGNDYAVLKVESFAIDPVDAHAIWGNLTLAAKAQGVTKLLIDISNNGGGILQTGNALAVSMFPKISYKWFENQFDLNYNDPMRVWLDKVYPVIRDVDNVATTWSDSQLQTLISSMSQAQRNALKVTANAMLQFCNANCQDFQTECQGCSLLVTLRQAVTAFLSSSTPSTLRQLIDEATTVATNIQPWTVTQGGSYLLQNGDLAMREINRGGVLSNLTEQVAYFTQNEFFDASTAALDLDHSFGEYVIVSNGVSGSTTAIFQTFVTQLWKNRDQSLVQSSVITCTYGGTSNGSDTTLTGYPASVQDVQIENPLVTDGALFMLEALLPPNSTITSQVTAARQDFENALYFPPYFADSLPRLPVVNYYDNFMEPGAMPLQYVDMPPDQHIPILFQAVTLADSYDLDQLYTYASQYFTAVPTLNPATTLQPAFSPYGDVPTFGGSASLKPTSQPLSSARSNVINTLHFAWTLFLALLI